MSPVRSPRVSDFLLSTTISSSTNFPKYFRKHSNQDSAYIHLKCSHNPKKENPKNHRYVALLKLPEKNKTNEKEKMIKRKYILLGIRTFSLLFLSVLAYSHYLQPFFSYDNFGVLLNELESTTHSGLFFH